MTLVKKIQKSKGKKIHDGNGRRLDGEIISTNLKPFGHFHKISQSMSGPKSIVHSIEYLHFFGQTLQVQRVII